MIRAVVLAIGILAPIIAAHAEDLPIRPDDALTPGVVASTDEAEVCATGPNGTYSQQHRQTSSAMKAEVYHRYGVDKRRREFEIDCRSTILTNQVPVDKWREVIGEPKTS